MEKKFDSLLVTSYYSGKPVKTNYYGYESELQGMLYFFKTYDPLAFYATDVGADILKSHNLQFKKHNFNEGLFSFNAILKEVPEFDTLEATAPISSNATKILNEVEQRVITFDNSIFNREFDAFDNNSTYAIGKQQRFVDSICSIDHFSTDEKYLRPSVQNFIVTQQNHINNGEFNEYTYFNKLIKIKTKHNAIINEMMHHLRVKRFGLGTVINQFGYLFAEKYSAQLKQDFELEKIQGKKLEVLYTQIPY